MTGVGPVPLVPLVSVLLSVHAIFAVGHFLSLRRSWGRPSLSSSLVRQQLIRWGHAVRAWAMHLCVCGGSGHPGESYDRASDAHGMAMAVAAAVQQRRKFFMQKSSGIALRVNSAYLIFVIASTSAGAVFWVTWPKFLCAVCLSLLLCVHHYTSWEPRLTTLRLFFGAFVLIAGFSTFVDSCDMTHLSFNRFARETPLKLFVSIALLDVSFVIPLNLASSVMFAARLCHVTEWDFSVSRAEVFGAEVMATLTICAVAKLAQETIATSCRHVVEVKASKIESQATAKVLSATCDAVVQLDEHLKVAVASTKLAALLLHGSGPIAAGSDFLQHLQGDDERQSFRAWLEAPPGCTNDELGLQAKLRDSSGSAIHVEMFRVPFETMTGRSHNFVGIREKVTEEHCGPAAASGGPYRAPRLPDLAGSTPEGAIVGMVSSSESATASSVSTPGTVSSSQEIHEIDGCPVFKFDAATFRILGYSPGFSIGSHRLPRKGSMLMEQLPRCDMNTTFARDYVENAQILLSRAQASPDPVEVSYRTAMVFSPSGTSSLIQVGLSITMHSLWRPDADREDPQQLPCVVGTAKVMSVARENREASAASSRAEAPVHPAPISL